MIEDDPIQGVSFRNTKRHYRKKTSPVGPNGPRFPIELTPVTLKDAQDYVHPRRMREPKCSCGYPARNCDFMEDDERNYCYKEHG